MHPIGFEFGPRKIIAGFVALWATLFVVVAIEARGLFGRFDTDFCLTGPPVFRHDAGIDGLFALFVVLACPTLHSWTALATYAFNAFLLAPFALLLAATSRSWRDLAVHGLAAASFLVLQPRWFSTHRIEGMTVLATWCLNLCLIRSALVGGRLWPAAAISALAGLVLGMHDSARQSAIAIPLGTFLGTGALLALGLPRRSSGTSIAGALARYAGLAALALGMAVLYEKDFSFLITQILGVEVTRHGAGVSLLVGLGWADTPYNITWDDDFAAVQMARMVYGIRDTSTWLDAASLALQADLSGPLFFETIRANPHVMLASIAGKIGHVVDFVTGWNANAVYNPVQPSPLLGVALFAFVLETILVFGFQRTDDPRARARHVTLLPLFLSSLITALLVAPVYLTALLAFVVMYVASTLGTFLERPRPIAVWARPHIAAAIALVLCLLLPALVHGVSSGVARHRAEVEAGPLGVEDFADYRSMATFNLLGEADRAALARRLASDPAAYLAETPDSLAQVALLFSDRVCVVARFPASLEPTPPWLVQGPRNSALVVGRSGDPLPGLLGYHETRFPIIKLADAIWSDQSKMVCMWAPPGFFDGTDEIRVDVVAFVGGKHDKGLEIRSVASSRLVRNRQP